MARESEALAQLRRWIDSGGDWTVLRSGTDFATIVLRTCDGGEVVGRIESADDDLFEFVEREKPSAI